MQNSSQTFPRLSALISVVLLVIPPILFQVEIKWTDSVYLFTYSLSLIAMTALLSRMITKKYQIITHGFIGLFFIYQYVKILYWLFTKSTLDYMYWLDSWRESISTVFATTGFLVGIGILLLLILLWFCQLVLLNECISFIPKKRSFLFGEIFVLLLFPAFIVLFSEDNFLTKSNPLLIPRMPDNSIYSIHGAENVFIVQLESINALASSGMITDGKPTLRFMPKMREIGEKMGIFMPFMWGHTIQSQRGLASILCGVSYNVQRDFARNPDDITTTCLPEILQKSGYQTMMLSAFADSSFQNLDVFFDRIGFEESQFGTFFEPTDTKSPWGYNDTVFYKRAFDYIEKNHNKEKPLFALLEVTANHADFKESWNEEFTHLWEYSEPKNLLERYINSALIQDNALETFIELYKKEYHQDSHLFIVADHSWPLGVNGSQNNGWGATTDNFLVPFLYIPPASRSDEFNIGKVESYRFGQSDILPTIADLLSKKTYKNSFAFALNKNESETYQLIKSGKVDYENCQVMSQPYNNKSALVARGDDAVIYSFNNKTLDVYNLKNDLLQKERISRTENVSVLDFEENYMCDRLKRRTPLLGTIFPQECKDKCAVQDASEIEISFAIKPGSEITHLRLSGKNIPYRSEVFINDVFVGFSCEITTLGSCTFRLDQKYNIEKRTNTLRIKFGNGSGETKTVERIDAFSS